MTTTQFWKGFAMMLVSLFITAFTNPPIVWGMLIVTAIGSVLVYLGTNAIIPLRPISLASTLTARDVIHALLILIGNAFINGVATVVIEGKIDWLTMGKIALSIALTYLGSTLFAGPYSVKKVSWGAQARLEYQRTNK